jgi:O-antigen ligase
LNDIQWISPVNFRDGLLGGAVSAHNFWLQTYIEFGLIYFFLWVVILYFLLLKILNFINMMGITYRLSIYFLILSHLILLNFNDEGGLYSRAPAISLYLLVLFGLWVRLKNYQPSRRYVLLKKD